MLAEVSADVMNCDCIIRLDNQITLVAGKKRSQETTRNFKIYFYSVIFCFEIIQVQPEGVGFPKIITQLCLLSTRLGRDA